MNVKTNPPMALNHYLHIILGSHSQLFLAWCSIEEMEYLLSLDFLSEALTVGQRKPFQEVKVLVILKLLLSQPPGIVRCKDNHGMTTTMEYQGWF